MTEIVLAIVSFALGLSTFIVIAKKYKSDCIP